MKGLMKKLLAMGLLLALALTLGGCGTEPAPDPDDPTPPDPAAKYPATLRDFLREDPFDPIYSTYGDGLRSGALPYKEAEAMFGPDVDMVFRTGNGMVALLIDKDKEELVLESMNEDGTDRKRVLTIPQGNALVRGALSRWGGDGWLLVNGWGTRAPTEGVQYRDYYYYYQPANEYMVFSITCPDHLAWGVDMALTRSAFLWSHETEEHYQKRKERGAQLTGPNEVLDIECYIYDIYVGKSYYLGRTFLYGGEVWETYYRLNTDSPTFKEWMASYLEQRNKDIAAMG